MPLTIYVPTMRSTIPDEGIFSQNIPSKQIYVIVNRGSSFLQECYVHMRSSGCSLDRTVHNFFIYSNSSVMNINIEKPSEFLVDNIDLLPCGRVLDVAMGCGRNAVYMAKMGYLVEGLDISSDAVSGALELARKHGVKIQASIVDLEKGYQIPEKAYDVIICFNYLQRSLIQSIKNGVRCGGFVVYETFIIDQTRFGRPKNPDYLLKHNELLVLFDGFRCLRYREGIINGARAVAGIIAEKVNENPV